MVEIDAQMSVVSDVDLILVDTFGHVHGADLDELVRDTSARVVIFSWDLPRDRVDRAIANGVAGFLSKALPAERIVSALEAVHDGETVVLTGVGDTAEELAEAGGWPGESEGLTPREAEVLAFITQGLSNKEIAERAFLSINSIKTYIRSAYRKIGATRRSQAVSWGMRNGFEPDPVRVIEPPMEDAVRSGDPAGENLRKS
ncbi:MAG TPA: response regulator transcription factor [Nocardioides sp.]|nr:response regulator transcription factor [Nocardioides sp.]